MTPSADEQNTGINVKAASDIEIDHEQLDKSIADFVENNPGYYQTAFHKVHAATTSLPNTFNWAAAILGPIWGGFRGVWGFFWGFLILEMIVWVQMGRGIWGSPGARFEERAEAQLARADGFRTQAEEALAAGEDASRYEKLVENMTVAAERSMAEAQALNDGKIIVLLTGLAFFLLVKLVQGFYADRVYERQYSKWRIDPEGTESGVKARNLVLSLALVVLIAPLTIYKFTVESPFELLNEFPEKEISTYFLEGDNETFYTKTATWLEDRIDATAVAGQGVFDGLTAGVRSILEAMTLALIVTPWPVVMVVVCVIAWRAAGPRTSIFTGAALAYVALLGYWEVSMETVALVGAAVFLCVIIGIPLGIWFGKSQRAYKIAEPVLDLMQTLPAFVYLIPIIAFFGTGNPPGILATIIFGMPPVIRLTALGMKGVPKTIIEAAEAFGASKGQLLRDVEIPLALPSIMTGVNQTILMCLSMVVIISLIGGGGLGQEILLALQYAAKGPGLLGGFAILLCAMVIDRIVQGAFRRDA
ncbi:MAG: ABC transporter permease subunit [Rhodobacteraceae bacterium]|nr:ABC transporter permease subunit [Paracoccaceae bacterium]MYI91757.1 ABC transporter permease subunit [Paracoccaceae bacterium]